MSNCLYHHGILGMRWGIRRYQNEDGTLTEEGKKREHEKDLKWAKRREDKITNKAYKKSKREMVKYQHKVLNKTYTQGSRSYMNAYNQKLAELMSQKVSDISTPSGKAVKFVAKRGGYGVYMAIADQNYNMDNVKNGVWSGGRIAYKKQSVGVG